MWPNAVSLLALIRRLLAWRFFSRRDETNGAVAILAWWELRRIPYNVIVGATGVFTSIVLLLVAGIASEVFGEPLGLPDPPIIAVFAAVAYGVGANVCYTGGWMAELVVRQLWQDRAGAFAEISFFLGLLFSVLLTLAPAGLFTGLLMLRLLLS